MSRLIRIGKGIGSIVKFYDEPKPNYLEKLPLGTYNLEYDPIRYEYYLEEVEPLSTEAMYGDTSFDERIYHTFGTVDHNITALLCGVKGTGKTLEAKRIAINSKLPVIQIKKKFTGELFVEFFSMLPPSCVFIDEFEKLYDTNIRSANKDEPADTTLLQLFDGVIRMKHLFILTSNASTLGDLFTDRLGRVMFKKAFGYLNDEQITIVAKNELKDKSKIDSLLTFNLMYGKMTYDVLRKIIHQMNNFNLGLGDIVKFLNLSYDEIDFSLSKVVELNYLTTETISKLNKWLETRDFYDKPSIRINLFNSEVDLRSIDVKLNSKSNVYIPYMQDAHITEFKKINKTEYQISFKNDANTTRVYNVQIKPKVQTANIQSALAF